MRGNNVHKQARYSTKSSARTRDFTPASDPAKDKVVEAALELFVSHGYEGTSTEDVATAARASKSTIYSRFRSKEDLFTAVMLAACQGVDAPSIEDLDQYPTLPEALAAAAKATLYRVLQPRGLAVLEVGIGAKKSNPVAMKIYWENGPGVAQKFVRKALQREKDAGRIDCGNLSRAASRFMNMIFGPFLYGAMFAGEKLPTRSQIDQELDTTIHHFLEWVKLSRKIDRRRK